MLLVVGNPSGYAFGITTPSGDINTIPMPFPFRIQSSIEVHGPERIRFSILNAFFSVKGKRLLHPENPSWAARNMVKGDVQGDQQ